jgi:hypothetical protein
MLVPFQQFHWIVELQNHLRSKWLSWIGPWSFHSFIGRMEEERTVPNPYLWGIRVDVNPTILDGLEIGMFRMMQLGGEGRPGGLSTLGGCIP